MREIRNQYSNWINGQKPTFGNKDQIALQKAAEAGVVDFKPVAQALERDSVYQKFAWSFNCVICETTITEKVCHYCNTAYYVDGTGRIFQLPTETEA